MPPRLAIVLGSIVPVALTLALLGSATWLGLDLRRKAAPVSYASETRVERNAVPIILGKAELGQHPGPKSAVARHLLVDRSEGSWRVGNAANDRRVFARRDSGKGFYLHRWALEAGDRIVLASAEIEVIEVLPRLVLRDVDSGRRAVFDDGVLDPDGEEVHLLCHSQLTRFARDARWAFRELAQGDALRLFSLGGGVNCTSRWSLPALEPQALHIEWIDGRYQAAPGSSKSDVVFRRGADATTFTARTVVVDGDDPLVSVILGRTVYAITTDDDALVLSPIANRDLWRGEPSERPMVDAAWSGAGLEPRDWFVGQAYWLAPGAVAALLVGFGVRTRLSGRRRQPGNAPTTTALAIALAALGAWITLLTARGEAADAVARYLLVVVAMGYASLVLLARGRMYGVGGLVWAVASALALIGTLVLLTLGAGAENTIWMRYFDKHALVLTGFTWGVAALSALPTHSIRGAWYRLFDSEWIVASAGVLLVLGMGAQLALGSEAGIGGIQPVELTKSVYVLLLGFAGMHLMEIRRRDSREFRRSPITAVLPFLRTIGGFALVVLSVVVGVRDFSPGIILGLLTLFWLFRVGRSVQSDGRPARVWFLVRPAVLVGISAVVGAAAWAYQNPEELPDGMPQRDRLLVWSQPELHPHSGAQVLAGMDRVAEGGWWGARAWFGENEEVMKVPAVQDDFITAFLLNRFGGAAGLALLSLQLVYLLLLFSVAGTIERNTETGDFREQHAGRVLGFALYGLAWMHGVHWAIAWCNTLGLLPVMGQPMTWLSAGNSHLLGFALLSLTVGLVTSWVAHTPDANV